MIRRAIATFVMLTWTTFAIAETRGFEFTYQGSLIESGNPADGEYDFELRLFDGETAGSQIGNTLLLEAIPVNEGAFTAELDFGSVIQTSEQLWLEIGVRLAGGSGFTLLTPRQKLTATPFASVASSVPAASITGNEIVDGSVDQADLAMNSVNSSALADFSVDALAIQDGAVVAGKLASESVGSNELQDGSIQAADVDSSQIQLRAAGTCESGTFLAGIQADGDLICNPLPIGLKQTLVADAPGEVNPDIAIRLDGRPMISYYGFFEDNGYENLNVFDCADAKCTSGIVRTLVFNTNAGRYSSIAIRPDGRPFIAYYDSTNQNLDAFDCADVNCSSGTVRNLINDANSGEFNSVAIRPNGTPFIAYNKGIDLYAVDCENAGCSAFTDRMLGDDPVGTGYYCDVTIRPDGRPIISHANSIGLLQIFDCDDTDCSSGTDQTAAAAAYSPMGIVIRQSGLPLIASMDNSAFCIWVYDCQNTSCSIGTSRMAGPCGSIPTGVDLALRDDGLPMISLYDSALDGVSVIDCTDDACTAWSTRLLEQGTGTGPVGFGRNITSIAIGEDGLPIITYAHGNSNDLKVYNCGDSKCEN